MNRIDFRPVVQPTTAADGGQLRRHLLQELERQWLDSWGAVQSDTASADSQAVAQQGQQAAAGDMNGSVGSSAEVSGAATSGRSVATIGKTGPAEERAATTRQDFGLRTERANGGHVVDACVAKEDEWPSFGGVAQWHQQARSVVEGISFNASSVSSTSVTGASPSAAGSAQAAAGTTVQAIRAATAPLQLNPVQSKQLPGENESDPPEAQRSRPRQPSQATNDLGPHKLMLRELTPELVQATLRDTQLDAAASQLAAQGLARALMEAGYAQVKVVVNGHRSNGDADDAPTSAPASTASVESFPEFTVKDTVHGN
jgi:hypothetical protein